MGQSPRQLIGHHPQWRFSWLAGLLVAAACGTPIETRPIPHPDLAGIDDEARAQIAEARTRLGEAETAGTAETDLAIASGELGRLYQAYDFDDAAIAAYWNAAAIAPEDFRWLYHLGALELEVVVFLRHRSSSPHLIVDVFFRETLNRLHGLYRPIPSRKWSCRWDSNP